MRSVVDGGRRNDRGPDGRRRQQPRASRPPDDTGETVGLLPSQPDRDLRLRARALRTPRRSASAQSGRRRCARSRRSRPTSSNPAESGGDLCVQACSDDPQVAFHAIRNLARIGRGTVVMRWSQLGFGRTSTHQPQPGHAAQPDGLQGRHRQHQAEDGAAMRPLRLGRRARARPGCAAAPTWSAAGSGCCSRSGTAPRSKTRSRRSAATSTRGRRWAQRRSSTRSTSTPRRAAQPVIPVDAHVRLASADGQRRRADPAPRLLLHRRRRREPRRARSRPLLHLLPARPRAAVRRDPAPARPERRAQRVHQARRQRRLRGPAGGQARRLRRRNPARLTPANTRLFLSVFVRVP